MLLGPADPLPGRPRRVLVAGTSGSGKTTLAVELASRLSLPHVELDALYHGPGWRPRPEFAAEVDTLAAGPGWVTEWQYPQAREVLAGRADLLVWLDVARPLVLARVLRRTVRRRWQRTPLWNGNVEPPLRTLLSDRDHIVRWSWRTHPQTAQRVRCLLHTRPDLPVVRLRSRADARRWLAGPLAAGAREQDGAAGEP